MLRVIQEVKPTWIVGENVFGLINWSDGLVFNEVQTDLETAGYEVQAFVLPACAADAPHRRDRLWIVAKLSENAMRSGCVCGEPNKEGAKNGKQRNAGAGNCNGFCLSERIVTNANDNRLERNEQGWRRKESDGIEKEIRGSNIRNLEGKQICNRPSTWENFPTESPVCFGNDGLSAKLDGITFPKWRNESIKAAGNAIVPQIAFRIFDTINQYNKQTP